MATTSRNANVAINTGQESVSSKVQGDITQAADSVDISSLIQKKPEPEQENEAPQPQQTQQIQVNREPMQSSVQKRSVAPRPNVIASAMSTNQDQQQQQPERRQALRVGQRTGGEETPATSSGYTQPQQDVALSDNSITNEPTQPTTSQEETEYEQQAEITEQDRDVQQSYEKAAEIESAPESVMMAAGVSEKKKPKKIFSNVVSNERFQKAKKDVEERESAVIANKTYSGNSYYETMFCDANCQPYAVSIGTENILEGIREPDNNLIDIVIQKTGIPLTTEECMNDISILANAINSAEIEVILDKAPTNIFGSVQKRILRVHTGRGIGLHPTQMKSYNADFDGDPGTLMTDQRKLGPYSNAMDTLLDVEGNPAIDPDYFPIDPAESWVDITELLKEYDLSWFPEAADKISHAYFDLINSGSTEAWKAFLMKIVEIARPYGKNRARVTSDLLQSFYDFSIRRRQISVKSQYLDDYGHSNYSAPIPPDLVDLVDLVDEIAAGRPAPNFQEFTRFMNKYYGEVEGKKNVPFRLIADFGKAIKRTDLVSIGSEVKGEGTMFDLWQMTCQAGMSRVISGRASMGSQILYESTQIRDRVLKEVRLPGPDRPFKDFIDDFIKSYNRNVRLMKASKVGFRNDMSIIRENADLYDGIDSIMDIAKPLLDVYSSFTVDRIFGSGVRYIESDPSKMRKQNTSSAILIKYRNMPLERFAMENRMTYKLSEIEKRIKSGTYNEMDILMLVADRRASQLTAYKKVWEDTTARFNNLLPSLAADIESLDFNKYKEDMLNLMFMASPNMFEFYGMDSPKTFLESKEGQALLDSSGNVEMFQSTWVSLMMTYRLERSTRINAEIKSTESNTQLSEEERRDLIDALNTANQSELEILASSSPAWRTIVDEMNGETNIFRDMVKNKGKYNNRWNINGKKFWKSNDAEKYYSIVNVLKSSKLTYQTKMDILSDVVRIHENYPKMMSFEMIGQIAHNPAKTHAGPRFDMSGGLASDINYMKESVERISQYKSRNSKSVEKNLNKLLKSIKKASDRPEIGRKMFMDHLERLAKDPGYLVHVDPLLAADAIASVLDKDFADTEKGQQQAPVNGFFGAVSIMRNGGHYTQLYQSDNRVIGSVGIDQLTFMDIARVFGDEAVKLNVYDRYGRTGILSRASLCGGNDVTDVIEYMNKHPRVAMAFRRCTVHISSDSNGTASVSEAESAAAFADSYQTNEDKILSSMIDYPKFNALAALLTPLGNNVSANMPSKYAATLKALANLLGYHATHDIDPQIDFVERTGITIDALVSKDITEEAAQDLYSEIVGAWGEYVGNIQNNLGEILGNISPTNYQFDFDENSIPAYYDVGQQLSGAKTATMIGVEGSETKKNRVFSVFCLSHPDKYMTVSDEMSDKAIEKLSEMSGIDIALLIADSDDGTAIIEIPEGWVAQDQTLESNPNKQMSSIGKFLMLKREKGAEEFNMKAKRFGDDGTNSITKYSKYDADSLKEASNLRDTIETVYKKQGKRAAVEVLADSLIQADYDLGYIDIGDTFLRSDYMNRADLMIKETEDGSIVIRSLEQLSLMCRNMLSEEAVESGDIDTVLNELTALVDQCGIEKIPDLGFLVDSIDIVGGGKGFKARRSMRNYSSSLERNYVLMNKIMRSIGRDYVMPSRKEIRKISKKAAKAAPSGVIDSIKGLAYPRDVYDRNLGEMIENPDGSVDNMYDFLGMSSYEDLRVIPGPQSLIYFDGKDSQRNSKVLKWCEDYGMTAMFETIDDVPTEYLEDAIPVENGYLLSFFNMKLNGSKSDPVSPAPASFPFNPDQMVISVEDTTYEVKPGDASAHATRELLDRTHFHLNGDLSFSAYDLFPNVFESYPNSDFRIEKCTYEEVKKYIVDEWDDVAIDIGIVPENKRYDREYEKMETRIAEYIKNFDRADGEDSILTGINTNDRIIGFVKIIIDGKAKALAPIIPFHNEQSGMTPTRYEITSFEINSDTSSFDMKWQYSGSIIDQYIKMYEGIGASNKMIVQGKPIRSRSLQNGLPIDVMYSSKSTESRRLGTNKRMSTLITMLMIPRMDMKYSHNFAETEGAFPGRQDFRDKMIEDWIPIEDWYALDLDATRFHTDAEIDAVVRQIVKKCLDYGTVNPSHILCTHTQKGWRHQYTEFDALLDTSYNFQESLMKLMNAMCPTLVPPSIKADSSTTLLKPNAFANGFDYGVLQMDVPHYDMDNEEYLARENVYISPSFFGDEFSGFKKVNINGSNQYMDDLSVSIFSGRSVSGFDLKHFLRSGMAGVSGTTQAPHVIQFDAESSMRKASSNGD